jgi:hypothetical protein
MYLLSESASSGATTAGIFSTSRKFHGVLVAFENANISIQDVVDPELV